MTLDHMLSELRWAPLLGLLFVSAAVAQIMPDAARKGDETPFLAANNTAMTKMMDGMAIRPTGDVDVDFAAMMIPHHQGAIEMAQAELRWGHNERLHRIAQEIIVDQSQEIAAMRLALGQPLPPSPTAPAEGGATILAPTPGAAQRSKNTRIDHVQ